MSTDGVRAMRDANRLTARRSGSAAPETELSSGQGGHSVMFAVAV